MSRPSGERRRLLALGLFMLALYALAAIVEPCDNMPGCYPPGVSAPK